ncbi:hypothetical protein RUND412_004414 [Rhizina undulata]
MAIRNADYHVENLPLAAPIIVAPGQLQVNEFHHAEAPPFGNDLNVQAVENQIDHPVLERYPCLVEGCDQIFHSFIEIEQHYQLCIPAMLLQINQIIAAEVQQGEPPAIQDFGAHDGNIHVEAHVPRNERRNRAQRLRRRNDNGSFYCHHEDCDRCHRHHWPFRRQDNLVQHLRRVHGEDTQ